MADTKRPDPNIAALSYRPTLSANLTRLIKASGYSQAQIADKVGCSKSALSGWVNGSRYPRPEQIAALASFFGVDTGELTEDVEARKNQLRELSSDAFSIARSYDELDAYGQNLVRLVVATELQRVRGQGVL
jgi:transcriptional regulator with XRE-family HTH domain